MNNTQIYIACGLTHVPRGIFTEYVNYIHRLAAELKKNSGVTSVRYALVDSDPQLSAKPQDEQAGLCYDWDRRMVEEADIIIADASFPSTGLGIELQIAEAAGNPVIMLVGNLGINRVDDVKYQNPDSSEHSLQIGKGIVSLMALGLPAIRKVIQYNSFEQAISEAIDAVRIYV
ncbi:hypothetical protein FV232_11090 [Methylobacterium sp. WL30]|uniref:nucleoside 2-deoxyribosyltransferase n=1 Tax=unclassified Methylobacterium TaxID=2615210 RepID=UPI0011CA7CF3|nr:MULTISPECIES: nucleoside 2-deoxyribosyltransferase [unclassified Methylobacterium]TXN41691.1 hypothetical protein FV225_01480 [Methylobacterium sp. WL93]TXN49117.1 hypothetical protein FV227_18150 [Methylobacterium sp. WL119]TXN67797.1 hypothetical protein FV232_11090 [Methylobacterium sp. WL30]TXN75987.1 hypothetical protein FV228_01775 [Methylobacterium sp. WL18]